MYSISAILSMTAHEWRMGMEFLARMEPMMVASLNVQSPASHNGSRKPLKNAPETEIGRCHASSSIN